MKFSVFATLTALAVAQPASAAIYQVTVTGKVASGFDQKGLFGAPNTDLTGAAFSLVEYFDTETGQINMHGYGVFGGTGSTGPSPGYGSLTINGLPIGLTGEYLAYMFAPSSYNPAQVYLLHYDHVGDEEILHDVLARLYGLPPAPPLLTLPEWHSDCQGAEICNGYFEFEGYTGYTANWRTNGIFAGESYDARVISGGVPEPATWAMMIVGFGLVGSALRRRIVATA